MAIWGNAALAATEAVASKPGRIVVLGDSLTAGYGLPAHEAYPALLQEKIRAAGLSYDVANAGVSGDTTAGGVRRIDWALSKGGDVLILALGGNDGLRGVPPDEMESNLKAIIRKAREKNPEIAVLVAGMRMPDTMGRKFADAYAAVFARVAREAGATLIPFLLDGVGGVAELNQPDRIHPTAAGQRRIAENIWPILRAILESQEAQVFQN